MVKELVERDKCSKNKEMSMFKEKPAVWVENNWLEFKILERLQVTGAEVRVLSKQKIIGRDLETLKSVVWVFHMEIWKLKDIFTGYKIISW